MDPIGVEKSQKVDVTETKIGLGKVPGKLRQKSETTLYFSMRSGNKHVHPDIGFGLDELVRGYRNYGMGDLPNFS